MKDILFIVGGLLLLLAVGFVQSRRHAPHKSKIKRLNGEDLPPP